MASAITKNQTKRCTKYVYPFAVDLPAPPLDRNLLGGKGIGLAEMTSIGIPVPPGFIISTEACNSYRQEKRKFPDGLENSITDALSVLGKEMGNSFGDPQSPLLVSVRSGARVSMPGMMDTVLNLGLNDETVIGFARIMDNERLAYDSYRRFITMYSNVVHNISHEHFEEAINTEKAKHNLQHDVELNVDSLKDLCNAFKEIYKEHQNEDFPQNPHQQLLESVSAVFNSWDCERAVAYRQFHHIPNDWGTAVTVQVMVFGNKGENSATGVGFTRDPATGEKSFYGEFLLNAQGEDVVAGIRTPQPINQYQKKISESELDSLEEIMPETYSELQNTVNKLEHHYNEMQDIEFTIDDGRLFMLQTRTGKRTGFAAIKIAMDMLEEGLIDEETCVQRIEPEQLIQLLAPVFDQKEKQRAHSKCVAKGLNAGPGAASGQIVFKSQEAVELKKAGGRCILVREETSPDDFPGMVASEGILTIRGGSTSHAAVVARGIGKPCIVGCSDLTINKEKGTLTSDGQTLKKGDMISIDGTSGKVYFCHLNTSPSEIVQVLVGKSKSKDSSVLFQQYEKLMGFADKYRTMKVRTNADTPSDCEAAIAFGAEGIGLCRTEHMFMDPTRLRDVRRMFFSPDAETHKEAIRHLLPHQREDFADIFRAMNGRPVTIRLLDPPKHEFLPQKEQDMRELANDMNMSYERLLEIDKGMAESNPMLGHRGCRLGIIYPEITEMQARAIFEAALEVVGEGIKVIPEIMVPLVCTASELEHQRALIDKVAEAVFKMRGCSIDYLVGTMIELPRAAITANHIAKHADFFSFGTNDLTQTTYGISRDDSGQFVPLYVQGIQHPAHRNEVMQIISCDPFQVLDREGVGELMKIACSKGKETNPGIKCGICGEHGGEARSVHFCHEIGLEYVSCSPYRVPVARLAAAQAALDTA
ncbi:Pyruvate, phosphate dikinase [Chlamydiales bacterium SCGC AG-110-M15]|nr:Pyruvate, phosphate dikinase [Chlamydiales bacterium SCGC AG-110-M15]